MREQAGLAERAQTFINGCIRLESLQANLQIALESWGKVANAHPYAGPLHPEVIRASGIVVAETGRLGLYGTLVIPPTMIARRALDKYAGPDMEEIDYLELAQNILDKEGYQQI